MPSSSRTAQASSGARSANRALCSASRIACRSAGARARGWNPVRVRDRGRLWLLRAGPVVPVPGGLRHAGRPAGRPGADPGREQGDRLVGYDLGPGSVSALSEIVSKSA